MRLNRNFCIVLNKITCPPAGRSSDFRDLAHLAFQDKILELNFGRHPHFESIDFGLVDADLHLHFTHVRNDQ